MNREFVAFIPVRSGSKGITDKNIKTFAGMPLVFWACQAATQVEQISTVFVSTDSQEYAAIINSFLFSKVKVIMRSANTSSDSATTEAAMLEFANQHSFDNIVLLQATSPFLSTRDLVGGIEKFKLNKYDSLLSVVRQKRFVWKSNQQGIVQPENYNPISRPRRQDWDGMLIENGAYYITTEKNLKASGSRLSGTIGFWEMSEESYTEIDSETDWLLVEHLFTQNRRRSHRNIAVKNIQLVVMDVDGVLTDAGMYYSEKGDELKKFNTRDAKGLELLRANGIKTAIITSENTDLLERRARKMKIDYIFQGIQNKLECLRGLLTSLELKPEHVLYIGDDLNDLEVLKFVGFACCPADAVNEVKQSTDYICTHNGGAGCVREVCDYLLNNIKG